LTTDGFRLHARGRVDNGSQTTCQYPEDADKVKKTSTQRGRGEYDILNIFLTFPEKKEGKSKREWGGGGKVLLTEQKQQHWSKREEEKVRKLVPTLKKVGIYCC